MRSPCCERLPRVVGQTKLGTRLQKFSIKHQDVYYWNQDQIYASVSKRVDLPVGIPLHYFDPLTVGLCDRGCMKARKTIEQCAKDFTCTGNCKVIENGDIWTLEWKSLDPPENHSLYVCNIDTAKGFVPVKYQLFNVFNGERRVLESLSSQWELREGCAVPVAFDITYGEGTKLFQRYTGKIEWLAVNTAIPETSFGNEAMDLDKKIGFLDARTSDPFFIKEPAGWRGEAVSDVPQSRSPVTLYVSVGVLAGLILLAILFQYSTGKSKPNKSEPAK